MPSEPLINSQKELDIAVIDQERDLLAIFHKDLIKPSVFERLGFHPHYQPTANDIREATDATVNALQAMSSLGEEREVLLMKVAQASQDAMLELAMLHKAQRAEQERYVQDNRARLNLMARLNGMDRDRVIKELVDIGEPVVGLLIQALDEQDEHYSDAVQQVLEAIGESAFMALVHALKNKNPAIRDRVAQVLKRMRDPRAVDAFIQAIDGFNSDIRVSLFVELAIGTKVDSRAIAFLIRMLNFDDPGNYAAAALVNIGEPAVEALITALGSPATQVRLYAAYTLGEIRDRRAVSTLIEVLEDPYFAIRRGASQALGLIGDPRAIEPLLHLLEDPHSDVRSAAAVALGLNGDHRALAILCKTLKGHSALDRMFAAQALGCIHDPRAVQALILALRDPYTDVRAKAVASLGQIADPYAVESLIQVLKDNNDTIQKYAVDALVQIGQPAVEALKAASSDTNYHIRKNASAVLKQMRKR